MIRKVVSNVAGFVSAIAFGALFYASIDSLVSWVWPQFNGVMVYRFAEFFPRSLGIYFLFLLPVGLIGLPFYFISKRLPGSRNRAIKAIYNVVGAAVSLIIPIILFEIPNKLALTFYEPVFLIADFVGLLLMVFITVYLAPLVMSITTERLPKFTVKTIKVISYLSLVLVAFTQFALYILPDITRPSYDPNAPNLLVISIDTLRKDHLSYYGYDEIETPNIDAFLESGTRFDNAYCSSPWTLPSLASFLTGYQPSVCRVDFDHRINDEIVVFPEILRNNGYKTEFYNTNKILSRERGYSRGFDVYTTKESIRLLSPYYGTRLYRYIFVISDVVKLKAGLERTDTEFNYETTIMALKHRRNRPFFIWCHFYDPHHLYTPPDEYIRDSPDYTLDEVKRFRGLTALKNTTEDYSRDNKLMMTALYNGEIEYVDECVGKIIDALYETEHAEDTIVVLFSDHGEEFWDHGRWNHGYSAYPELIDMVFAIQDPNIRKQPPLCGKYTTHIDIMPSLLDALSINSPEGIQGKSFYDDLLGSRSQNEPAFCEYMIKGEDEIKAVRREEYLFIRNIATGDTELYDISEDPRAINDLSGTMPEIEGKLSRELDRLINENDTIKILFDYDDGITLSDEDVKNLRAMGYMGN
ncbi:MAG: sulfatase-like hydrolase/transferase [bacterium]|nr:sulfatase-like hydrolase/transferase [bacterium]